MYLETEVDIERTNLPRRQTEGASERRIWDRHVRPQSETETWGVTPFESGVLPPGNDASKAIVMVMVRGESHSQTR